MQNKFLAVGLAIATMLGILVAAAPARAAPDTTTTTEIVRDHVGWMLSPETCAEFEFTLTFANAPLDRFARGEQNALTKKEKKGALLFFGRARCVECHSVAGPSNEMFSDFQEHVIGVPQIVPEETNNVFDGPDANQDFGKERVTGDSADRYMFRTSPLRNVALQPTFMHNGAFTRLEDAVRHHLDVVSSVHTYSPAAQELALDLRGPMGPMDPVLERLDPVVAAPIQLSKRSWTARRVCTKWIA